MARFLHILLLAGALIGIAAWGNYYYNIKTWDNKIINSAGDYRMTDKYYLSVKIDSDDFISLVFKQGHKTLVVSNEKASAFQKFEILWENETRRLWFDSGDIGTIVYMPGDDNQYTPYYIVPKLYPDFEKRQLLIKDVPKSVRSKLRNFSEDSKVEN